MKKIQPLLDFYHCPLANSFNSLVKPIANLELDIVFYTFIQSNGTFFQIGNFPEGLCFYWHDNHFKSNPFIRNPKFYKTCTLNLSEYPSQQFQEELLTLKQYYDSSKVFGCFFEEKGNIHWIGYGSTNFKLPMGSLFVNERQLLEKFSRYIINEWKGKIIQMEKYTVELPELLGQLYNQKPNDLLPNSKAKLTLLHKIDNNLLPVSLSQRETQCLLLLSKGKTAREIAEILKISTRTAETHIEHLKNKLMVTTKSEAIEKGLDLFQFGILKKPYI